MRKDIQINVNSETNQIVASNDTLGITSENLQGKIIFKPQPFVDGACRLYIEGKGSILMDKQEDCYTLPIKSSLLKSPGIDICFKIIEPTNEEGTPIFATKIIYLKVLDTIKDNSEIPEQYPTWIETFDSKIAEINELEQSLEEAEQERNRVVEEAVENIEDLTAEYNQNAADKTNTFNQNAVNKTNDFNTNVTNQTSIFDNHVTSKAEEFDADTDDIVGTKRQN